MSASRNGVQPILHAPQPIRVSKRDAQGKMCNRRQSLSARGPYRAGAVRKALSAAGRLDLGEARMAVQSAVRPGAAGRLKALSNDAAAVYARTGHRGAMQNSSACATDHPGPLAGSEYRRRTAHRHDAQSSRARTSGRPDRRSWPANRDLRSTTTGPGGRRPISIPV